MSTVDWDGAKVVLSRSEPERFWAALSGHYLGNDSDRWRGLAMFALREQAGWPPERIAAAFRTDGGEVGRVVRNVRCDLQERFVPEPRPSRRRKPEG